MPVDSPWAYAHVTIEEPEPRSDSDWAYAHVTIGEPTASGPTDSPWAYSHVTIREPLPPEPRSDSDWAYVHVTIRPPHHPIGILTPDGLVYVPISAWNGTTLG